MALRILYCQSQYLIQFDQPALGMMSSSGWLGAVFSLSLPDVLPLHRVIRYDVNDCFYNFCIIICAITVTKWVRFTWKSSTSISTWYCMSICSYISPYLVWTWVVQSPSSLELCLQLVFYIFCFPLIFFDKIKTSSLHPNPPQCCPQQCIMSPLHFITSASNRYAFLV